MPRSGGGFTLVELMITVAIVGIVGALAIYVYGRYVRKARMAEVPRVFGAFQAAEDTYHADRGRYLGTTEGSYFPTPNGQKQDVTTGRPAYWTQLRVQLGTSSLYCGYAAVAGRAGDATGMGTMGGGLYGGAAPTSNWYYLMAQCDWDGDPSVNTIVARRGDRSEDVRENDGR